MLSGGTFSKKIIRYALGRIFLLLKEAMSQVRLTNSNSC